jgi:hypothetical protein
MGQADREQHVDRHQQRRRPGEQAQDHAQRRHHLAHVGEISQERRQAVLFQHALDAVDPVGQLGDTVQQHQAADSQPQQQLAHVFAGAEVHRRCGAAVIGGRVGHGISRSWYPNDSTL